MKFDGVVSLTSFHAENHGSSARLNFGGTLSGSESTLSQGVASFTFREFNYDKRCLPGMIGKRFKITLEEIQD